MGGIATRTLRVFKDFCGYSALKNVIIVTNMWDKVTLEEGEAREVQLRDDNKYFKPFLSENATMRRHNNTLESARRVIQQITSCQPFPLDIQTETVVEEKPLRHTSAGTSLRSQLLEVAGGLEVAMNSVLEALKAASGDGDRSETLRLEKVLREYVPILARLHNEVSNMDVRAEGRIDVLQEWNRMDMVGKIATLLRRCYGKEDIREKTIFWSAMGDTTKIVQKIFTLFEEAPLPRSVKEQFLDVTSAVSPIIKQRFDGWLSVNTKVVEEMEMMIERAITSKAESVSTATFPFAIGIPPRSTTPTHRLSISEIEVPPPYTPW